MSANNIQVGIRLTIDGRNVQGTLNLTIEQLRQLGDASRQAGGNIQQLNQTSEGLIATLTRYKNEVLALAAAYGVYKVADYIKDASLLAARYETLGVVMQVVGNNAGYTGAQMAEYAKGLERQGISMMAAREGVIAMTQANLDLAYSEKLAGAARDLAVVSGKNTSDTYKDLITNIQQADTEGLRYMGVILDSEDALKKYGKTIGVLPSLLSPAQKSQAVMNAVLLEAAKASGTYEKAMGTAGKALSSLDRYFENIKIKVGTPLLEGFATGVFGATDAVKQLNVWLDELEKDGSMEKIAKSVGEFAGKAVSAIGQAIDIIKELIAVFVELVTGIKDFLKEHETVMTAAKAAAAIYVAYMVGTWLISMAGVYTAAVVQAWGWVSGLGLVYTAALAAARTFAMNMVFAFALGGLRGVLVTGARLAIGALMAFLGTVPALIVGATVAIATGIAYFFGDAIIDGLKAKFPMITSTIKSMWEGAKNLIGMGDEPAPRAVTDWGTPSPASGDNQDSIDASKARKAKELADAALNAAVGSSQALIAVAEAHNTRMNALDAARTAELQRALDQRTIESADYYTKKGKMEQDAMGRELALVAAQKAALSASMAAPSTDSSKIESDKGAMIKLMAQENALQTQMNASKKEYANTIAKAVIESYTKEWGDINSLVDAKRELLKASREEIENAGKTQEALDMLSATRISNSANELEAMLRVRIANKLADDEEVKNTNLQLIAMRGLANAKAVSAGSGFTAELIATNKNLKEQTETLVEDMKNTFISSEEERIQAAANASLRIMNSRKNEYLVKVDTKIAEAEESGDDEGAKRLFDSKTRLLAEYDKYEKSVNESAKAQMFEASNGWKTLTEAMTAAFDPNRAQAFGDVLQNAFGNAGSAAASLINVMQGYNASQKAATDARAAAAEAFGTDEAKMMKANRALDLKQQKESLSFYANVTGAAKGFFKEKTAGYKLLETAEKAFRIMQFAMQMQDLYTHLFVTGAKVAGTTAGQAGETAAVGAGEMARNLLKIPGVIMSFMSALGPWGMAAAGVAIAAVLGGAFSGGGSSNVAEQRQKSQGTGSIKGDDTAKSESVSNALEKIKDNTFQGLTVSLGMLNALNSISANIKNFAALVMRDPGISGDTSGETYSSFVKLNSKLDGSWGILSKLSTKISNAVFGGKKTVEDVGFTMKDTTVGQALQNGFQGQTYADIKKSGGWFHSDKWSTETKDLSADTNNQFKLVIQSMADGIKEAGMAFGVSGDAMTQQLNSFVINIGKVSLKGLSDTDAAKEIEAVFSKLGDDMAAFAFGGLKDFQKTGEGMLETVARLANDYQTVDVVLNSLGMSFGQVGFQSIAAREHLIEMAGGLEAFTSSASQFMNDFYSDQDKAAALAKRVQPIAQKYGMDLSADNLAETYKKLVLAQNTATTAGAAAYAELMSIEPAMKTIVDAMDELKDAAADLAEDIKKERDGLLESFYETTMTKAQLRARERAELNEANRALFDQVETRKDLLDVYEDEKTALTSLKDKMKSSQESMLKFKDSLTMGNLGLLTPAQKAAEAAAQYNAALENARKNPQDANAYSSVQTAATAYLTAQQAMNGSTDAQLALVASVQKDLLAMADLAGKQMTDAEVQLNAMKDAVGELVNLNDTALSIKDAILAVKAADVQVGAQIPFAVVPQAAATVGGAEITALQAQVEAANKRAAAAEANTAEMLKEIKLLREQQAIQAEEAKKNALDVANYLADKNILGLKSVSSINAWKTTSGEMIE